MRAFITCSLLIALAGCQDVGVNPITTTGTPGDTGTVETTTTLTTDSTTTSSTSTISTTTSTTKTKTTKTQSRIDCLDILESGESTGDGIYEINPLGVGTYEVYCLMDATYDGGGWTLTAVSSDDGQDTWTWTNRHYWDTDTTTFGDLGSLNGDYKSAALHEVGAGDLLFAHQPSGVWAAYNGITANASDLASWLGGIGGPHCLDPEEGYPMSAGTLSVADHLCSTDLYISPEDWDGSMCGGSDHAYGPTWSANQGSHGCPFDDPGRESSLGPMTDVDPVTENYEGWGYGGEPNPIGFGKPLGLNTGSRDAGENYMWVLVRRSK
jgi:hypothetical protein